MLEKLKSRKLWAMVAGATLTALGSALGIPIEQTAWIAGIVVAYILGQSVVDAAEMKSQSGTSALGPGGVVMTVNAEKAETHS